MNGVPFQTLATSMIRYNMESRMKAKQAVTMINDTDLKKTTDDIILFSIRLFHIIDPLNI